MTFTDKLNAAVTKQNSLVCVGLDSQRSKLPAVVKDDMVAFNTAIIDATHDLVCAYKFNSAFYEAEGAKGLEQLKASCDYLVDKYPDIPILLDAKRADIGNTNDGYIDYAFNYLRVDAITLHPYLGGEALAPFLDREDKGLIILCRTSNPGAGEFQDLQIAGQPLYHRVAQRVGQEWNTKNNCLLVVGATYPTELAEIRQLVGGKMAFLVPGIGAQGGDVAAVMKAGLGDDRRGLIINSSRGIIFASSGEDYAEAARAETEKLQQSINNLR